MKIQDILTDAYTEIRVGRAGDVMSPEDAAFLLARLNDLLDAWNVDGSPVWATRFDTFTLTPSLQPHTIGPTGTFTLPIRPVRLLGANLVLDTSTPAVYTTITIRDAQWWLAQQVPGLATAVPTDVYYSPDWTQDATPDNGSLYFWPVPTTAYQVQLQTWVTLGQVLATDTLLLPPGYRSALKYSLAEDVASSFGQPVASALQIKATKARARIFNANVEVPQIATADWGVPDGTSINRGSYSFYTGPIRVP